MTLPLIADRIWVCVDCILEHANGEVSPDRDPSEPEPWALWKGEHHRIAMGGEHAEGCENGPESDTRGEQDCDCETRDFSRSSCDGCGSRLHGVRHAFTVFDH